MKLTAVYFCFFFCCFSGYSQYQIQHFTTENGLPSNGIKGMQWDETTGFLWLATEAGLVRFNGMGFKNFDMSTNPDFGSDRIVFLLKNEKGRILTGGEAGNLLAVKENIVTTILRDERGAQYNYNHYSAATASDVLFRKCVLKPWGGQFTIFNNTAIPVNDTVCVARAEAGMLYYYSVSTSMPVAIKTIPANTKTVFKIGGELYYLDSLNRLFSFDVLKNRIAQMEATDANGNKFVIQDKNSNLFWQVGMEYPVLIQDGKAWRVEKKNNQQLQFAPIASGIPEDALFRFVQYKKNGDYLFLATDSKGIYIIHKGQLIPKQPADIDINQRNSFYSQVELPDGNILTNYGRIIGDRMPKNYFGINTSFINSVFQLKDNSIILSQGDSLFIYNRHTQTKKKILIMHTYGYFSAVETGGKLYFANQKGIGVLDRNMGVEFETSLSNKINSSPFTMIEYEPGKLALATCDGLFGFDTHTKQLDTLLKIPAVCVRSLYKYGEYVFIGTYGGGFYVMKKGKLKAMPLDNNRYLKYTHCFIEDDQGFCWISTNKGIFKVKTSDITDAYEKNLPQIYYHYLGKDDGMKTTEMNGGCMPCAIRMKDRNFSFPTMDGLLWFNPEKVNISLPEGELYIDRLKVNDNILESKNNTTVDLPDHVKKLEIALGTNAWCKKENLYIEYKLNNDNWLAADIVSNEPVITFNNLEYGEYILKIRKLNGFGANNYSHASISFSVATPFYHRWGFRLLCLLALGGITYFIFWLRLRQYNIREKKLSAMVKEKTMDLNLKNAALEKNDQIKTRLISVINHDIITPLKFMHYAGSALVQNKGNIDREQELETISDITQTAKDMEMLSSQILNWIIYQNPNQRMQKEEFDLQQLTETVLGVLRFPAKLKNTTLHNKVDFHFVVYQYLEPLRVLIYNMVLNAVNFTKEGTVSVESSFEGNNVVIKISDTGLGMTQEQIDNLLSSDEKIIASANVDNKKGTGLGYMIIKDLLKIMGGSLTVQSSKKTGTTVSVSVPAIAMH